MEKGITWDVEFGGLTGHHVDGIVQEGFSKGGASGGQVDGAGRVFTLSDGEGTDVSEMGVGNDNGVGGIELDFLEARDGVITFFLRVHSGIEDDGFITEGEGVGICADFLAKGEGLKGETGHREE